MDGYPEQLEALEGPVREALIAGDFDTVTHLGKAIRALPNALHGRDAEQLCPLTHEFDEGHYTRTLRCPAGVLAITKIIKQAHPFFLLEGEVMVRDQDGLHRLKAPHMGITKAGTQRAVYTLTDVVWATVHQTDETDLDKIEAAVTVMETQLAEPALREMIK